MKLISVFLILFVSFHTYSQKDKNGNPIVNSVTIDEIQQDGFKLSVNYYSLGNNISNPNSAVFISNSPTKDEIEKVTLEMFSYFYLVIKNQEVVSIITLNIHPESSLLVVDPKTNRSRKFEIRLRGKIVKDRATEIIREKFDLAAKIDNGYLYFNDHNFQIIERDAVDKAVVKLIRDESLAVVKKGHELSEFQKLILSESRVGGNLDVFTDIKGREKEMVILFDHLGTKENVALYQWGRLVLAAGITSLDDVVLIYSKLVGRVLNDKEMEFIAKGFNKEWEK